MSIVDVCSLTKDYGNGKGIENISFQIQSGEVFGFLGPNGAGKTTTLRCLMGFIKPDSGSCSIFGSDCLLNAHKIHKRLGYLPGELSFFDNMAAGAFIKLVAAMRGISDLKRANNLVDIFGLDCGQNIKKMSKGNKQKISVVCAFMGNPEIVLLDEPTSGLDPLMQNKFVELIESEKQKGTTILMSSHIFEEVSKTCDRAAIIKSGQIVSVENIEELSRKGQKKYIVKFESFADMEDFSKYFPVKKRSDDTCIVSSGGDINELLKKLSEYSIKELDINENSLEEIFLHYYGGAAEQ
ncbi:MAG: ABC transporter ATP-binding protein [Oscillospiraceae bacterium]